MQLTLFKNKNALLKKTLKKTIQKKNAQMQLTLLEMPAQQWTWMCVGGGGERERGIYKREKN
jgi:hypothetical protein